MAFGLGSLLSGGAGFLTGGWGGAAMGLLGSLGGSGKKKKGSNYGQQQEELLALALPYIRDPHLAANAYRDFAMRQASQGAGFGSLLSEQTGNPNAGAAYMLGQQNRANESSNQFAMDALSPKGRAEAAMSLLGGYSNLENQRLNRQRTGLEFRQPTFANQVFGSLSQALPWYLSQQGQGGRAPVWGEPGHEDVWKWSNFGQGGTSPGFGLGSNIGR